MRKITRVFVSGASHERIDIVQPWMVRLRECGFEITHDWTGEGYDPSRPFGLEDRQMCATLDLRGVASADVVWGIIPEERGNGGQDSELGYAYGLNVPIVLSGTRVGRNIFHLKMQPRFEKHEDAFKFLLADDLENAKNHNYFDSLPPPAIASSSLSNTRQLELEFEARRARH